jgi:hypothetical protein
MLQKVLTFCNFNSNKCNVQRSSTSLANGFSVTIETVILIFVVFTKAIPFEILNFCSQLFLVFTLIIHGINFIIVGIDLAYNVTDPDSQGRITCSISSSKIVAFPVVAIFNCIIHIQRIKTPL